MESLFFRYKQQTQSYHSFDLIKVKKYILGHSVRRITRCSQFGCGPFVRHL